MPHSFTPAVSVVMSVRNGMPFLERCIESVLHQTFDDFEFIIIDHDSTDDSPALLARAAALDRRCLVERMRGGALGNALNRGLQLARGPYVARIDADDLCLPERFEKQLRFLESKPDLALAGTGIEFIDEQDRPRGNYVPPTEPEALAASLLSYNPIVQPTVMIRRTALEAVGGYRPQYLSCGDYDLWLRMSERYAISNLADILVRYRLHSNNMTRVHYARQAIAAAVARRAAIQRRRTGRDPTTGIRCVGVSTLCKLNVPRAELRAEQGRWVGELFDRAEKGSVPASMAMRFLPDMRRISLPMAALRDAFQKAASADFRRTHGWLWTGAILTGLVSLYPAKSAYIFLGTRLKSWRRSDARVSTESGQGVSPSTESQRNAIPRSFTPAISVIMSVRNGMPFLERCIESVLHQTFRDFEFIIIDHDSTDTSPALLARAAALDRRCRIERMCGGFLGHALNRGLQLARGCYIARIDADDVCLPERFERQLRFLESNPDLALTGTGIEYIDEPDRPHSSYVPPTEPDVIAARLLSYNPIAHPSVMIRRSALDAVGGYRPQYLHCEDYDLWLRMAERYSLSNLADILVQHRAHTNNVTQVHYAEQMIAAAVARRAAMYRRRTGKDPTNHIRCVGISTLRRFDLSRAELRTEQGRWVGELFDGAAKGSLPAVMAIRRLPDMRAISLPTAALREALQKTASAGFRRQHGILQSAALLAGLAFLYPARSAWILAGPRLRRLLPLRNRFHRSEPKLAPPPLIGYRIRSARLSRHARNWLAVLSDPLGPGSLLRPISMDAGEADELFEQAERHGVLGPVLRNVQNIACDARIERAIAAAIARHRNVIGLTLMIEHHARALMRQIREQRLEATVVKGPIFAERLYPERTLRRFTDLDVLVVPEAVGRLEDILRDQHFERAQEPEADAQEWKWVHRDYPDVMVELHTDLVHARSLREAMSLTYRDLVSGDNDADSARPAALLLTAAVHGACHQFERLLHVLDVCQAARTLDARRDLPDLKQLIGRSGALFATVSGLCLAGRIFSEPRCFALAESLGPAPHAAVARWLIGRSVVTSSMGSTRWMHSWRRSAYRELLKRGTPSGAKLTGQDSAEGVLANAIGDVGV